MKKFYLTLGGILTILGSGGAYNEFDVQIVTGDKIIVFDTKTECRERKAEIIEMFESKELKPDQAFVLKAFVDQDCGIIFEKSVPLDAAQMTVTESNIYYTRAKYNERKNDLYKKTKADPHGMTIFEQRELIGIVNEEMKKNGSQRVKSLSPHDIVIELEKK